MGQNKGKTDPVEDKEEVKDNLESEKDENVLSMSDRLSVGDFAPMEEKAAKEPHPFDGYPKKKMRATIVHKDGQGQDIKSDIEVNPTHIIALSPGKSVFQDPSGRGLTRVDVIKDKSGKVTGEKTVKYNLESHHNRVVQDWEHGGTDNIDIVFDRILRDDDGRELRIAMVPAPSHRAQIVFSIDPKTGKTRANQDYMLPDNKQVSRLRTVFNMVYRNANPEVLNVRKFEEEPESQAGD